MTTWPLVEVVAHFRAAARERLLESHRHAELIWGELAPHTKRPAKAPKPHRLLTEDDDDG